MLLQSFRVLASAALTAVVAALQFQGVVAEDGPNRLVYNHSDTGCSLDIVKNSGICETTPGVNQYSGYLSVGADMNMWFWFFEARKAPAKAPLVLWLNGGPGCSSMIGLFQETGPCKFAHNETTTSLNPHSWNEHANMLYVDQPIGTGLSYGTEAVASTVGAAPYVWNLLQAFFGLFPQYINREFGLFSESYGGHYGPEFVRYFEVQNKLIRSGRARGELINLVALGINNGNYDVAISERNSIEFSYKNSYYPLINESTYHRYAHQCETDCLPALKNCTAMTGQIKECTDGVVACMAVDQIYEPYTLQNMSASDIRQKDSPSVFPLNTETAYLRDPAIMKAIGAKTRYRDCMSTTDASDTVSAFVATVDGARTTIPILSTVVRSGVQTVLWAGDADLTCDWFGNLAAAHAIEWDGQAEFRAKAVADYTVNGVVKGTFKTVGNLSWLKVHDAGHKVPAFQPELALQVLVQTMQGRALYST